MLLDITPDTEELDAALADADFVVDAEACALIIRSADPDDHAAGKGFHAELADRFDTAILSGGWASGEELEAALRHVGFTHIERHK